MLNKTIKFFLEKKLVTVLLTVDFLALGGVTSAPFNWEINWIPRNPVPVDAVADGENQQVVYTEWIGKSPQDIEEQKTYPLTLLAPQLELSTMNS